MRIGRINQKWICAPIAGRVVLPCVFCVTRVCILPVDEAAGRALWVEVKEWMCGFRSADARKRDVRALAIRIEITRVEQTCAHGSHPCPRSTCPSVDAPSRAQRIAWSPPPCPPAQPVGVTGEGGVRVLQLCVRVRSGELIGWLCFRWVCAWRRGGNGVVRCAGRPGGHPALVRGGVRLL